MPSRATSSASRTSSSIETRSIPGIDGTATRCFVPSMTNIG
jgi:hypothetical protein